MTKLIEDIKLEQENGEFRIKTRYCPTLEHAEDFAEATGDTNRIHRKHPRFGEAISPGFLQTSVAVALIEAGKSLGNFCGEYPFSLTEVNMAGIIVTGQSYNLDVSLKKNSNLALLASARFMTQNAVEVCRIERKMYSDSPYDFSSLNQVGDLIFGRGKVARQDKHFDKFKNVVNYEAVNFGLVGHLFEMSGSSSAAFEAINDGKLSVEQGVVALYSKQRIYSDISNPDSFCGGLDVELYLTDRAKFGVKSKSGEVVDMHVAGTSGGKPSYVVKSSLSFQDERILDLLLRRAMRDSRK